MEMTSQGELSERLIFPASPALVEEIRAYWHDQRLNNKSEGIRKLIEAGLAEWRKSKKAGDVRPRGKMTKWVRVSEER